MSTTSTHWAPPHPAVFSADSFLPSVTKEPVRARFRPVRIATDQPANRSDRVLAKFFDIISSAVVVALIVTVVALAIRWNEGRVGAPSPTWTIAMGVAVAVPFGLRAIRNLAQRGTSIGRRHVGIRVVRATTSGPLGLPRAIVRTLVDGVMRLGLIALVAVNVATDVSTRQVQIALVGLIALNVIDAVLTLGDQNGRTIPDRLAGSTVVGRTVLTSKLPPR